mgnify:CR=1 FL=1
MPPFHCYCRTTTTPYFEGMELDGRVARNDEGKSYEVTGDLTYEEWYDQYVEHVAGKYNEQTLEAENADTKVKWNAVKSKEYRDAFEQITSDYEINRVVHSKALDILKHRDGTEYEDMHLIDLNSKKVVASQTHSKTLLEITYNDSLNKAVAKHNNLLSIHNHPNSLPPSGSDFSSAFIRGYKKGVVIGHDGSVYV